LDTAELEIKVKKMYSDVALNPAGEYHFEMGRGLAEKLGYPKEELDLIPAAAVESFAGVGYFYDMANLEEGERVLDLGSGSGMDVFTAALKVGITGRVTGVDMTDAQLGKAARLGMEGDYQNVTFQKAYIDDLPFPDASFDVMISNGVINLCPDKAKVFKEMFRVLKQGGRMVIADIVSERQLPENVVCDSSLWAACIGGASQEDDYLLAIGQAGFDILRIRNNDRYEFISRSAKNASREYGVKSVSVLAQKK